MWLWNETEHVHYVYVHNNIRTFVCTCVHNTLQTLIATYIHSRNLNGTTFVFIYIFNIYCDDTAITILSNNIARIINHDVYVLLGHFVALNDAMQMIIVEQL